MGLLQPGTEGSRNPKTDFVVSCRQSLFSHKLKRNISNRQGAVVLLFFCAHLSFIMADRRFRAAGSWAFA